MAMMNDLDWKQPALVGGLIVGIMSAIPGVSALNCCFCAWALIGGCVAAKMTIDRAARPVSAGEGAQIGLMAGAIAAVAFIVVAVPIILSGVATNASLKMMKGLMGSITNPELQAALEDAMVQAAGQSAIERLLSSLPVLLIQVLFQGGFTVLGGLLGVALFEKRKGGQAPPPPPPPYYGQPPVQ